MPPGYITLADDFAALFGPLTDPATDTESAAIIRHSSDTIVQALARAAATIAQDAPNPWAVGPQLSGTVSYNGGAAVTGVGTAFLSQVTPGANLIIEIPAGQDPFGEGYHYALQASAAPTSDTSIPIGGYAPYFANSVGAVAGVPYRSEIYSIGGGGFASIIEVLLYYDFGWALYQAGYKYGNAGLLTSADTVARLWWDHPIIATARRAATVADHGIIWPGSRHGCLGTLLIWALRGCPGAVHPNTVANVWTYAYDYARAMWGQWLEGKEAADHIPFDTRDGGYALHWLDMVARVHPDPAVRADCDAKATAAERDYFTRLQYPDGTWRAPDAWKNATTHTDGYPAMQAFLVALLLNALIDQHRRIHGDPARAVDAARVLATIKKGIRGLMLCYGGAPHHAGYTAVTGLGSAPVRGFAYAYGGPDLGYDVNTLADLVPGELNRWWDPKRSIEFNVSNNGYSLAGAVAAQRFLNATSVHAPFYAAIYSPIGSTDRADFLAFGDELLNAQWEYTDGDGFKSQYDTPFPKNKDWDEHMRAQMRGLAWRKLAVAGATTDDLSEPPPPPPPDPTLSPSALDDMSIIQGSTSPILFFMSLASDATGRTPAPGLAPTVTLSKAGAPFAAAAGAVAEVGNGWYKLTPTAADTGTLGDLAIRAVVATADDWNDLRRVVTDAGAAVLAAAAAAPIAANIKQVNATPVAGAGTAGSPWGPA